MKTRWKVDAVKITFNIAITVAASTFYLLSHQPTTCSDLAAVTVSIGANLFGLFQKRPQEPTALILP